MTASIGYQLHLKKGSRNLTIDRNELALEASGLSIYLLALHKAAFLNSASAITPG